MTAAPSQQPNGTWLTWMRNRNHTGWHWFHDNEPTAYCGARRPEKPKSQVTRWNPYSPCRKCLDRIAREGY